jgi:hypothetical protein
MQFLAPRELRWWHILGADARACAHRPLEPQRPYHVLCQHVLDRRVLDRGVHPLST